MFLEPGKPCLKVLMFQAWYIPCLDSRPGTFYGMVQVWMSPWNGPGLDHSVEWYRLGPVRGMVQAWTIPGNGDQWSRPHPTDPPHPTMRFACKR